MTRVRISADGTIDVEHEGADLSYVIDQARQLWEDTKDDSPSPGPAYGFHGEISQQWNHEPCPTRAEAA